MLRLWRFLALLCCAPPLQGAETFRVATYNLQNYLDAPIHTRPAKSEPAKAKVRESILGLKADVLALQEMGTESAFAELRSSLEREGCHYPYAEFVHAWDTNIHIAVLSRFPITARRTHTNDSFLLFGKRHWVKRGFAEVEIRVNDRYTFTLFTAHLKSKLSAFEADEAELREQEALTLRQRIDSIFARNPNANVIVAGDLNDTKDSKPVRSVIGRRHALIDTRPAERNGDDQPHPNPDYPPPAITWTHYYGKEDSYRRIDYILLSRGMAREWVTNETHVLKVPNWGVGSDHRPIVATFLAQDK